MAWAQQVVQGISSALKVGGDVMQAKAADEAASFNAQQLRRSAKETEARGIREAKNIRREGDILQSDAIAALAAGGGSTTDPGAVSYLSKLEDISQYNQLAALYDAQTQAQGLRHRAQIVRYEGKVKKKAGYYKAASTLLDEISGAMGGGMGGMGGMGGGG